MDQDPDEDQKFLDSVVPFSFATDEDGPMDTIEAFDINDKKSVNVQKAMKMHSSG